MSEINIKSSTIEKSIDLVKDLLEKFIEPSINELGLLVSDNIKLWRLKNQIRNLEKIKKIVEKDNISIKQINLKILVPYLEGVSLEEDEELQNLWANLFVNYIDTDSNLHSNVYPNILKQISTREVHILNHISSDIETKTTYEEMANLERLGLVKEELRISKYGDGDMDYEEVGSGEYFITNFGSEFIKVCSR